MHNNPGFRVLFRAPHACGFTIGHVHIRPQLAEHALLPRAGAELVPDDGVPVVPGLDAGVGELILAVANECDLPHHCCFLPLQAVLLCSPCA